MTKPDGSTYTIKGNPARLFVYWKGADWSCGYYDEEEAYVAVDFRAAIHENMQMPKRNYEKVMSYFFWDLDKKKNEYSDRQEEDHDLIAEAKITPGCHNVLTLRIGSRRHRSPKVSQIQQTTQRQIHKEAQHSPSTSSFENTKKDSIRPSMNHPNLNSHNALSKLIQPRPREPIVKSSIKESNPPQTKTGAKQGLKDAARLLVGGPDGGLNMWKIVLLGLAILGVLVVVCCSFKVRLSSSILCQAAEKWRKKRRGSKREYRGRVSKGIITTGKLYIKLITPY